MARRKAEDVERDWYGVFAKWDFADRVAALKVLTILHRELPERKIELPDKSGELRLEAQQ